jgi:WD40 repeat protein
MEPGSLDFAPDGRTLVVGDADRRLRVVDLAGGKVNFEIPEAHPEPITFVAWSPKDPVIASSSGYTGGPIRHWDAASGQPLGALEGHTSWICELVFSADGRRLYSAGADQTIRVWDMEQRRCLATLHGSSDEVYGLSLSPDGTTLASAGKDGVVAFWKAAPRPEQEQPRLIPFGRFVQPVFAPTGRVFAVPRAGTVSLFDPATAEEIEQLPALGVSEVETVAYSADGTLLASGSRTGKIRVWSCAEHRLLQELYGSRNPIPSLGFRADGTQLISIDAVGKATWWDAVKLWDLATLRELMVLPGQGSLFTFVAFSPEGRWLAACGNEGKLHLWQAPSWEEIATAEKRSEGP